MSPSSTSRLASHASDHKRWRLASWGHGDEATAMAVRAAYNGMNWPVFENAAKKMSTSQFFHGSARGPGPKPISDEKCKVDIL